VLIVVGYEVEEVEEEEGSGHLIPSYAFKILSIDLSAVGRWNSIVGCWRDLPPCPCPCPLTPFVTPFAVDPEEEAAVEANIPPNNLPSTHASSIAHVAEHKTCGGGA